MNVLALTYNRYEIIDFKECYVVRKNVLNDKYFIYTDNDSMIQCPKKIYTKIVPQKKYLLTYRKNKLNRINTNKIIASEEIN